MTDFALSAQAYLIKPGYVMMNQERLMVYGVLGSGVFVAVYDARKKYSGCCSFLFPRTVGGASTAKYGDRALRHLVLCMLAQGSSARDLRAHVIGGGIRPSNTYGEQNTNAALEVLHELKVRVESTDTGGGMGRKFVYDTATGENMIMKVHNIRTRDWYPYKESVAG